MLTTEQFLKAELCNVERALNESLRYDYGGQLSAEFYQECTIRHLALKRTLEKGSPKGPDDFRELAFGVSELSGIIARIERSRLGEYSRAFADVLSRSARSACTGDPAATSAAPLFFYSSEGGLASYAIHPGQDEHQQFRRRIFNVIFPRSLKYHVLIHPILGHEVGHALMNIPVRKAQLQSALDNLFEGGPFEDVPRFKAWMKKHFPDAGSDRLEDEELEDILTSWRDEFFCDLFGLVSMGPAFMGAVKTLFAGIDLEGTECGDTHPPTLSRYAMLHAAVEELNWSTPPEGVDADTAGRIKKYWKAALEQLPQRDWLPAIDEGKVKKAAGQIQTHFADFKEVVFKLDEPNPLGELIAQLKDNVPPVCWRAAKPDPQCAAKNDPPRWDGSLIQICG